MTRELTGVRLSELARCPLMCAHRGLGHVAAEPSVRARRYQARGQMFGWYAYRQFVERYGAENVEREVEIEWPLGVGHADIYVVPEKLLIEVVSSTSPSAILPAKMRQVRQYLHYHPEAESAAVYVINPSDLDREDLLPVMLDFEDSVAIEDDVESVRQALDGGLLPPCSASSPSECRNSYFCPFTDLAWADWEPPAPDSLAGKVAALAGQLYLAEVRAKERKALSAHAKAERDELRTCLRTLLTPGVTYEGAGVRVRYTESTGRETLSLAAAREAGIWTAQMEDALGPFLHRCEPVARWTVGRVDGQLAVPEYDEEIPF